MSQTYRDLKVWQKAMGLVARVYEISKSWPSDERFGLISQVRRAAVSIPSNIAEGNGRLTPGEGIQCLSVALGSLFELETQLILAGNLKFTAADLLAEELEKAAEIGRMLRGLIDARARAKSAPKRHDV